MEAVEELIKDHDVNAADELDGSTALHEAAINGMNGRKPNELKMKLTFYYVSM